MKEREREEAQRLSEHIEKLLAGYPGLDEGPEDGEFGELCELAGELGCIKIEPPAGLEQELARSLGCVDEIAESGTAPKSGRIQSMAKCLGKLRLGVVDWLGAVPSTLGTVVAAVVLVGGIGLALVAFLSGPRVSAADILGHSQSALAKLAQPGKFLYRRWDVVYVTTRPDGKRSRSNQVVHEWMDGSNHERAAARSYDPDGRLLWAYADVSEDGTIRPHIYLSPGFAGGPDPVLNIEPTRHELGQAADLFSPVERHLLLTYLDRSYIYHPIVGDHWFNRGALQGQHPDSIIPRTVLSVDTSLIVGGARAYRVSILEPVQVRLMWRSRQARVGRVETVRYISQESYLSLRAEEQVTYEDGGHVSLTWDIVEIRTQDRAAEGLEDVFELQVPPETLVRRHSAVEMLRSYSQALQRAAPGSTD